MAENLSNKVESLSFTAFDTSFHNGSNEFEYKILHKNRSNYSGTLLDKPDLLEFPEVLVFVLLRIGLSLKLSRVKNRFLGLGPLTIQTHFNLR